MIWFLIYYFVCKEFDGNGDGNNKLKFLKNGRGAFEVFEKALGMFNYLTCWYLSKSMYADLKIDVKISF